MPLRQDTSTGLMDFLSTVLSQSGPNRLPYCEDVRFTIRGHLNSTIQAFPGLTLTTSTFQYPDGRSSNILQVEGTIPMHFQSAKYNIPVKICLLEDYPRGPPLVSVVPTRDMVIKVPHPFVDATGVVRSSHLQHWVYPRSDLQSMVQQLSEMFGKNPPLYSRSIPGQANNTPPPPSPPVVDHSSPPSSLLPSISMPNPHPSMMPYPGNSFMPHSFRPSPSPPPPPPPMTTTTTTTTNHALPTSRYPHPGALTQNPLPFPSTFLTSSHAQHSSSHPGFDGMPMPHLRPGPVNGSGASPLNLPSNAISPSSSLPITTPMPGSRASPSSLETSSDAVKRRTILNLQDRLDADVTTYEKRLHAEEDNHRNIQVLLARRSAEIETGVRELVHEKEALEHRLQVVLTNTDVLESWLRENAGKGGCGEGRGEENDADDDDNKVLAEIDTVFLPFDSLSRQLLESTAEDLALEDVMYSLDKALHDGVISLETYMKHTRICAREQFFQRATELLVGSVQAKHHPASYGGGLGGLALFSANMNARRTSYPRS
ncbi:hypothetical protein CBR_g8221 [Chara braunii]|uniref:UEV domain-containing protein n=1 Tax=Chara braunii TaxID=69332 RepID=A0A388KLI9_CHABU|nr:hypothetical protein CBR_g8221 [Chara braunii]|eukprot:GBG70919.1 hypothetical protein CBR_g8221 [Chara braunii]